MGVWAAHSLVLLKVRHFELRWNDNIGHKTHVHSAHTYSILPSQLLHLLSKLLAHLLSGHVLERSWVTRGLHVLVELPHVVVLLILLTLRSCGPQMLLLILLLLLLVIPPSLGSGVGGSSVPLVIRSVEEVSLHPIKRRIRCLHSWKFSIASGSSHVSGEDGRNDSSCVVSCSCSGGNGGGGPLFLSCMLSREHLH